MFLLPSGAFQSSSLNYKLSLLIDFKVKITTTDLGLSHLCHYCVRIVLPCYQLSPGTNYRQTEFK